MSDEKKSGPTLKCFVMMPFGSNGEYTGGNEESDFVYDQIIVPAIRIVEEKLNLRIDDKREVDRNTSGSITKSIVKNIAASDICIVDITGQNPNVFFELGIRYGLRHRTTILFRQDKTKIPFDISSYRCMTYRCFKPQPAIQELAEFLIAGLSDPSLNDSLVFETFSNMQVHIPGILSSALRGDGNTSLSWDEWYQRVQELGGLLKDPFDNGRFVPDAVFGISNGGLVVADFLGREVFRGIPILSLWAHRWLDASAKSHLNQAFAYFDNNINRATLEALRKDHDEQITILMADDLVYTANTLTQAANYIKDVLTDQCEILFTPLYCRNTSYLDSIEEMLPHGYKGGTVFNITKRDYYATLHSGHSSFPYQKHLGSE